jgi:tetratricopeptide (TPR) repeat protein
MILHARQLIFRKLLRVALCISLTGGLLSTFAVGMAAPPQADPERLFADAVQDYNNNRFASAQGKLEKIQGSHAQDAAQYLDKIKSYKEAITAADAIIAGEDPDAVTVESAIREYKAAIRIKSHGPGQPEEKLAKAEEIKKQIESKNPKLTTSDLCNNSLSLATGHHYNEAAVYSCRLALELAGSSCGGVEASVLCEEQKRLANEGNPTLLGQAQAAYAKNNFERARALFLQVPPAMRPAADAYVDKISHFQNYMAQAAQLSKNGNYEDARTAFDNAANIKPDGPGNPRAGALKMKLVEGLDQFYSGDYVASAEHLEDYVQGNGEKQALAHFYLGASKLARFYLTGNSDDALRQDALKNFKDAKQAGFKAEAQEVSPKIMQAYRDLVF